MIDHFLTLQSDSEALRKEKASKFYAYAHPIEDTTDVDLFISTLKSKHLKARHFCYAYILNPEKDAFRANDDGEPSGTAGKPILGQIEKLGLTNTLVVVVRYFGGTKLGTSGLIKAYKAAAAEALAEASIIEKFVTSFILLSCDYEIIGTVMNIVSNGDFNIKSIDYEEEICIKLEARKSEIEKSILRIKAKLLKRSIADVDMDTVIDNVGFEIIE